MQNTWELYSSMEGWEDVSLAIDAAFDAAVAKADAAIADGEQIQTATCAAFLDVDSVLAKPAYVEFGSSDSEPRSILAWRLKKHMRAKHNVKLDVDRWGAVSRIG